MALTKTAYEHIAFNFSLALARSVKSARSDLMAIALYMDHHVPRAITVGLRLRGVDVITALI